MITPCQTTALTAQANSQSIVNFSYARAKAGLSLHGRNPVAERKPKNYDEESLNAQLVALADRMHKYIAVNHFYYDAVEALFSESDLADDANKHSHYGLTLITHWLCEQDKVLLESLAQLTSKVASMTGDASDAD